MIVRNLPATFRFVFRSKFLGALPWWILVLGLAGMIAQLAGVDSLHLLFPDESSIPLIVAFGLSCSGLSLLAWDKSRENFAQFGAVAVIFAGVYAVYIWWTLLGVIPVGSISPSVSSTNSFASLPPILGTAALLIFTGSGLALSGSLPTRGPVVTALASLVLFASSLTILVHIYGIKEVLSWTGFTEMALPSAIVFLLIGMALIRRTSQKSTSGQRPTLRVLVYSGVTFATVFCVGTSAILCKLTQQDVHQELYRSRQLQSVIDQLEFTHLQMRAALRTYYSTGEPSWKREALSFESTTRVLLSDLATIPPTRGFVPPSVGTLARLQSRQKTLIDQVLASPQVRMISPALQQRQFETSILYTNTIGQIKRIAQADISTASVQLQQLDRQSFRLSVFGLTLVSAFLCYVVVLIRRNDRARRTAEANLVRANIGLENRIQDLTMAPDTDQQERRVRADSLPQILWTATADGTPDYFNKKWFKYSGIDPRKSGPTDWHKIVHPQDLRRCVQLWAQCCATGEDYEINLRLLRASDHTYRWHLTRALPQYDAKNRIRGWVGTCTDMEEQKLVQLSLESRIQQQSVDLAKIRQIQQVVMDGTNHAIIGTSSTGLITMFNSGAEKMLGYSREELINQCTPVRLYLPEEVINHSAAIASEFNESIEPGFFSIAARARQSGNEEREWTFVHKDGNHLPVVQSITSQRDAQGVITGYIALVQNLSSSRTVEAAERKLARRLAKLTSRVPGMIFQYRLGPDGTRSLPYTSERIEEIYGISSTTAQNSMDPVWAKIHPDDIPQILAGEALSAQTLNPWKQEFRLKRPDGSVRWLAADSTPEQEPDGSILWHGFVSDVTERLEATHALRRSQQMFEGLFENAPDGILLVNANGEIDHANGNAGRLFGYSIESLVGQNIELLIPFRFRSGHAKNMARYFADPRSRQMGGGLELYGERKDGSEFPLDIMLSPFENENRVQTLAVIRDITDRKLAARVVNESEERFRTAFEFSGIGMAIVGLEGSFLKVNHSFCEIVGLPENKLLTQTFQDITHPDDLEIDLSYLKDTIAGKINSYQMEKRYFHAKGNIVWVRLTVSMVRDSQGNPVQFVSQIEDVTSRKRFETSLQESEEKLRIFAEHAPASVAMFDLEMRYLVASHQWQLDHQLEAEEFLGRSHYDLFPKMSPEWKATYQQGLNGIAAMVEAERFERADGSMLWLRWEVRPWRRSDDSIGGIIVYTQNITAQKELESTLANARDQALAASRLKSEFLANMSHEIRTPMNGVIGMAALLIETPLNHEQRQMGQVIINSSENLMEIINDILDFSKIEAGKMRVRTSDFNLREIVEETTSLLSSRAHAKKLELVCDFPPQLDGVLLGDAGRIRQVLTNLLGNALKFTAEGHVIVSASILGQTGGKTHFRISVNDSGIGIPSSAHRQLFAAFTQIDGTSTRRYGGTGLGLAISRQLVELMGGTIDFESTLDVGSTFWFDLELPHKHQLPRPPLPVSVALRTLIVDDHARSREILAAQLMGMGIKADQASDATSALNLMQTSLAPYQLVLVDLQMLDAAGDQLAVRISARNEFEDAVLVGLTSVGPPRSDSQLNQSNRGEFLLKPVREKSLRQMIQRHFGLKDVNSLPSRPRSSPRTIQQRILLAEDNSSNQLVVQMIIRKLGHQLDCVANGVEALARLSAQSYDLVLMDCQMPQLDGYETTREIRRGAAGEKNIQIPIIALTAYAMPEDRGKCIDAGMNDYLTKPLREPDFKEMLQRFNLQSGDAMPAVGTAQGSPTDGPPLDIELLESMRSLPGRSSESLLPELVGVFRKDSSLYLTQLQQFAAHRDDRELIRTAHAFAGSCSAVGAIELLGRRDRGPRTSVGAGDSNLRSTSPCTRSIGAGA